MHSKFFSRTLITIRTVVELSATRENWEFGKKVDDTGHGACCDDLAGGWIGKKEHKIHGSTAD